MRDTEPPAIQWIIPGPTEKQIDTAREEAKARWAAEHIAKVQVEYDTFREMRKYVIEHIPFMRDKVVPIEISSIQLLESHDCLIINDLLLVSFTEAKDMIDRLKEEQEEENERIQDAN